MQCLLLYTIAQLALFVHLLSLHNIHDCKLLTMASAHRPSVDQLTKWGDPAALIAHRLVQGAARAVLNQLRDSLHHLLGAAALSNSSAAGMRAMDAHDVIEDIKLLVRGSFDASVAPTGILGWVKLWVLLPVTELDDLVSVKGHHMLLLVERHLRRPLWTVVASFVRRAIGDMAMQLQVVIATLHAALIIVEHGGKRWDATLSTAGGDNDFSVHAATAAMDDFVSCLGSSIPSAQQELFFGIAESMQLHPSDYMRLLHETSAILASTRDDVMAIAARIRQAPHNTDGVPASNQEREERHQATGQFHVQLVNAMSLHNNNAFRRLVDNYGATTVKPYSTISQRNEGLSQQHTHLLNTVFSPSIVVLLTEYQSTTNLVAQYKVEVDARNSSVRSQAALSKLLLGAQLLEKHNAAAMQSVEEIITHCDALQVFIKSMQQWISRSVDAPAPSTGGTPSTKSSPYRREEALVPLDVDIAVDGLAARRIARGKAADLVFMTQTLRSVDAVVEALSLDITSALAICNELEETSQHVLSALGGLRHNQSTTLFPLGQLAAKMLREAGQLRSILKLEAQFLRPRTSDGEPASESSTWVEAALRDSSSSSHALLPVAARRSIMVLASTAATIHDASCLIVPVMVMVQESMGLHVSVVAKEQEVVAFEVVERHQALSHMQAQSIRVEETSGNEDVIGATDFIATLQDGKTVATRTLGQGSSLDVQFVADLLSALHQEGKDVAASVHSIVTGLRDTSDPEAKSCFDGVACFCTVVELLSKSIFPASSAGSSTSNRSSRSASVAKSTATYV